MASLEQFGIARSHTTSPALADDRYELGHDAYTEKAFGILHSVSDFVATELPNNLNSFLSAWHPSGFMVYQLGTAEGLGMLRLHVWPDTDRKGSEKGDTIHDHAWHVASLVLKGTYQDTVFDVAQEAAASEHDRKHKGLLRLFDASYKPDASQELTTNGTCVRATPITERTILKGEEHSINPSVFHQPNISSDRSVVTLVLNSFRAYNSGPYVLIDGPSDPIPEVRQPLSDDDIYIASQLLAEF